MTREQRIHFLRDGIPSVQIVRKNRAGKILFVSDTITSADQVISPEKYQALNGERMAKWNDKNEAMQREAEEKAQREAQEKRAAADELKNLGVSEETLAALGLNL